MRTLGKVAAQVATVQVKLFINDDHFLYPFQTVPAGRLKQLYLPW